VVIGLLQIIQTSQATTANYQIQKLEQQKLELGAQVQQLEAEVAGLSSITRIEAESNRMGLQKPQAVQAVEVNVPVEDASVNHLPTRFAPEVQAEPKASGGDSPWWRDLLRRLPFN
jgi:hypothetical protein